MSPWSLIVTLTLSGAAYLSGRVPKTRVRRWAARALPEDCELLEGDDFSLRTRDRVAHQIRGAGEAHRAYTGDARFDAAFDVVDGPGPPALAYLDAETRTRLLRHGESLRITLLDGGLDIGPFDDRDGAISALDAMEELAPRFAPRDAWPALVAIARTDPHPSVRVRATIALLVAGPDDVASPPAREHVSHADPRIDALARLRHPERTDHDVLLDRVVVAPRVVARALGRLDPRDDEAHARAAVALTGIEKSGDKRAWLYAIHYGRDLPALAVRLSELAARLATSPIPELPPEERAVADSFVAALGAHAEGPRRLLALLSNDRLFVPAILVLEHIGTVDIVPGLRAVAAELGGFRIRRINEAARRIQSRAVGPAGALSVAEAGAPDGGLALVDERAGRVALIDDEGKLSEPD